MLGTEVEARLRETDAEYRASDREIDITDRQAVLDYAGSCKPHWIVNCAAYTAVDQAEDEPDNAFRLNRDAVENLAIAARQHAAAVLHISTDYVFDGTKGSPYEPDDPPNPNSVYGASKLAGESILRRTLDRHIILRTAWLYGANGPNFVTTMLRLFNERPVVKVVDDQVGSPTWARDLAAAIVNVILTSAHSWGTYHFVSRGAISWFDFATEILWVAADNGLVRPSPEVLPISTSEYPTKAKRPSYSVLSTTKIEQQFGVAIPDWRESLRQYVDGIANENRA